MDGNSLDLTEERLKALKNLLPDVFTEGKIDFQRLREALGDYTTTPDHYELTWAGKADARREIQRQTTATLVPDFTESVDFDTSQNVYIEGENLEVLRVLQRSYFGKVKMIYIDPPYNTGNDYFVYPDDFAERKTEYEQRTGQTDKNGFLNKLDLFKTNNGQLHSPWLSMMYPRLFLARNLLREDGVIFVSIDDNEAHNLKLLMDEVFGQENFVANVIWEKNFSPKNDSKYLSENHDHILVFSKNKEVWRPTLLPRSEEANARYSNPDDDDRGDWTSGDLSVKTYSKEYDYPITTPSGKTVFPPKGGCWRVSKIKFEELIEDNRIWFGEKGENTPRLKRFLSEVKDGMTSLTIWERVDVGDNQEARREIRDIFKDVSFFDTPKPTRLIKRILQLSTKPNDNHIVMDFFAGSSTMAQSLLELNSEDGGNRRFVLVQLPEPTDPKSEAYRVGYESIATIGRERIRRVIKKMHQAVDEADEEVETAQKLIEKLQKELTELQADKPELFGVKPSKETQKLTDQIEKLEESLSEAREKTKRLRNAPKDFKAFRLTESNFENWRSEATTKKEIKDLLLDFKSPQRPDAESQAMLYEFLLKKGYPLTASVTCEKIDGIAAYVIEKREMWVLLDGYSAAIRERILTDKPKHVVCLDKIFAGNDQTLTNLHLDLRERNIELSII